MKDQMCFQLRFRCNWWSSLFGDRQPILERVQETYRISVQKSRYQLFISSIYLRMKTSHVAQSDLQICNICQNEQRCNIWYILILTAYLLLDIQLQLGVLCFIWQPYLGRNAELLQAHLKNFGQGSIPLLDEEIDQKLSFYTTYEVAKVTTVRQ